MNKKNPHTTIEEKNNVKERGAFMVVLNANSMKNKIKKNNPKYSPKGY